MLKKIWNHQTTVGDWIIYTIVMSAIGAVANGIVIAVNNHEMRKLEQDEAE